MFGGILNSGGIDWYASLVLPSWSPPNILIALIWAIIYVCATASLLIVWNKTPHDARFRTIVVGYGVVTLINFLWSILFFDLHMLVWSVVCSVVLAVALGVLAKLIEPRSRVAALLLLPYIVWVLFAFRLTASVTALNLPL